MIGLIIGPFLVGVGIGGAVAYFYIMRKNKKAKKFVIEELNNKKEVKPNAEGKETNPGTISKGEPSSEEPSAEDESEGNPIKEEGDELPVNNGAE